MSISAERSSSHDLQPFRHGQHAVDLFTARGLSLCDEALSPILFLEPDTRLAITSGWLNRPLREESWSRRDITWLPCESDSFHAILNDGALWSWNGWATPFRTGYDGFSSRRPAGLDGPWLAVARGDCHALGLRADGSLWAWGDNRHGQLGLGDIEPRSDPACVESFGECVSVTAWDSSSLAISREGELFGWGSNWKGCLGFGCKGDQLLRPTRLGDEHEWERVSHNGQLTSAIRKDGSLEVWAGSHQRFASNATFRASCTIGNTLVFALTEDDELYANAPASRLADAAYYPSPLRHLRRIRPTLEGPKRFASITCGIGHSLAVGEDGTLWSWGLNVFGQLGLGDRLDRWKDFKQVGHDDDWIAAAAGRAASLGLKADGSLWAWGNNYREHLCVDWEPLDTGEHADDLDVGPLRGWRPFGPKADHYPLVITLPAQVVLTPFAGTPTEISPTPTRPALDSAEAG